METKTILLYVGAFIGVLALLEMFFSYFKAGRAVAREREKWDSKMELKEQELETVNKALQFAHTQIATLNKTTNDACQKADKFERENIALARNCKSYADAKQRAEVDRDEWKELYEREARKDRASGGLGGDQPAPETHQLMNFFAFDHQPTVKEVKERYKRLSSIYHPDKAGGDQETFQTINTQYQRTLQTAA